MLLSYSFKAQRSISRQTAKIVAIMRTEDFTSLIFDGLMAGAGELITLSAGQAPVCAG